MKNIAIIGAGTMGNGIAHTFAQFDYKVQLIDISEVALQKIISKTQILEFYPAKEKISEGDKQRTLNNITTYTNLEEGVEKYKFSN